MKTFKKLNSLLVKGALALAVLSVMFTSCQQSVQEPAINNFESAELDVAAEANFDEIDDISESAMGYADGSIGGKTEGPGLDERASCATVTHDKEAKTITIDFGDGCTDDYGVTRSGIIFITYTGRKLIPGSIWTVELQKFYVNDKHIEGYKKVENVSESFNVNPKFHVVLTGGKITWPDGVFATKETDGYKVWVFAPNPLLNEMHILEGSVTSGVNKKGTMYSTVVLEDLIYKRSCRGDNKARIPVAGLKEVIIGDRTFLIEFGDGRCDSIVTIISNGDSREVDLAERG